MKKILLFILPYFLFAIGTPKPVCPDGRELFKKSEVYHPQYEAYSQYPNGTSNARSSGYASYWLNYYYYRYSEPFSEDRVTYTWIYFNVTVELYECRPQVCPVGTAWDFTKQKCDLVCKPNEKRYTSELLGYDECVAVCPSLDTYVPLTGIGMIDGILPALIGPDPSFCKTPPDITPTQCNAAKDDGYQWVCPEANGLSMLLSYVTDGYIKPHGECYCSNWGKAFPVPVYKSGNSKPRTSDPFTDTEWSPQDTLPYTDPLKLPDGGNLPPEDFWNGGAGDMLNDWLNSSAPDDTTTSSPNLTGKTYDYSDTDIVYDPVTGQTTFEPRFNSTPSSDGSTTVTNTGYYNNMQNSNGTTANTVSSYLPPETNLQPITPENYIVAYETATRTNFNLPEPTSTTGTAVVPVTVPTNFTGGTTTRDTTFNYVTNPDGSVTYTSTNNGTTTQVDYTNNNGTKTYVVTNTFSNSGSTYNNTYSYTIGTSGAVTYTTPISTYTAPTGSTYNNTGTGTNYNYNSTQQNLDELMNFEPKISDTAMTKPLNELITQQGNTLDFIDSIKNSINGIKLDFDTMLLKLQNPPQIHEKTGNCNLTAVFLGKTIVANPCTAFYPYRELIRLFLTVIGMFFVAVFAVENLNKG